MTANYNIKIKKQAFKDIKTLSPKLKEKLKDRLVYSINEDEKIVYLKRARTLWGVNWW
jgi:mRNA-degrading endonuclease RelE of RelBE toxin-antitoxin system